MKVSKKEIFKKKLLGKASAKETFRESFIKAQSAMEYLMTYGWAILIISVVLAALFQLGVFNPMTFAPKAPPGSCQVFRPNGPYTTSFINLEGICSGELPQYVASFGASTADQITVNHEYFQGNSFTILAWVYWPPGTNLASPGSSNGDLGYAWSGPAATDEGFGIFSRSDHWYLNFYGDDLECSGGPVAGRWYQFGASWDASTKLQTIWVNGAVNCTRTSSGTLITNSILYIGSGAGAWDGGAYMDGLVADIQIYNTSLSANDIQALYLEGISGAPIDLQNLVGWWPLNGNANDYSGNGNNGQVYNVNFVSNWYSGYTPP